MSSALVAARAAPHPANLSTAAASSAAVLAFSRFGATTYGHEPIKSDVPGEVHINQAVRMLRLFTPNDSDGAGVAEWRVTLNKVIRVVLAHVPIVKPLRSEPHRNEIEQSLVIHAAGVSRPNCRVHEHAPVHLFYEVFIRPRVCSA